MPRNNAVANLVAFAPSLLCVREIAINEDALPVGQKQSTQIEFLYSVEQQRRTGEHLFTCNGESMGDLPESAIFGRGVILTVKAQQLPHRVQVQRRLGTAEVSETLGHQIVDVARGPIAQEDVFQPGNSGDYFSLKNFTNSSKARCSSLESFSTDSAPAAD